MYLSSATETDNLYVTRGFFNIDFYTKNREDCRKMKTIVMDIMNSMDFQEQMEYLVNDYYYKKHLGLAL